MSVAKHPRRELKAPSGASHREKRRHFFRWYHLVFLFVLTIFLVGFGIYLARDTSAVQTVRYPLKYTNEIAASANRHELNPYWICAVIDTESGWNSSAQSRVGAVGLMQLLPETAQDLADWGLVDEKVYPSDDLTDPATNIEYGTAYLRYLVERYHEMQPAIAAYNAGPGNVDDWLEKSEDVTEAMDFSETAAYILKVEQAKAKYEELYPDAF
jgi:soluble lytic murein transglycosylase